MEVHSSGSEHTKVNARKESVQGGVQTDPNKMEEKSKREHIHVDVGV